MGNTDYTSKEQEDWFERQEPVYRAEARKVLQQLAEKLTDPAEKRYVKGVAKRYGNLEEAVRYWDRRWDRDEVSRSLWEDVNAVVVEWGCVEDAQDAVKALRSRLEENVNA